MIVWFILNSIGLTHFYLYKIHVDSFPFVMVHADSFSFVLIHFDWFWIGSSHVAPFSLLLIYFGSLGFILIHWSESCGFTLVNFDAFWFHLTGRHLFWFVPICFESFRFILTFRYIFFFFLNRLSHVDSFWFIYVLTSPRVTSTQRRRFVRSTLPLGRISHGWTHIWILLATTSWTSSSAITPWRSRRWNWLRSLKRLKAVLKNSSRIRFGLWQLLPAHRATCQVTTYSTTRLTRPRTFRWSRYWTPLSFIQIRGILMMIPPRTTLAIRRWSSFEHVTRGGAS